jgi:hypothetical protein
MKILVCLLFILAASAADVKIPDAKLSGVFGETEYRLNIEDRLYTIAVYKRSWFGLKKTLIAEESGELFPIAMGTMLRMFPQHEPIVQDPVTGDFARRKSPYAFDLVKAWKGSYLVKMTDEKCLSLEVMQ